MERMVLLKLIYATCWINFLVSLINIIFTIKVLNYDEVSFNLRGTQEKLLDINLNYFLEKEIEIPKKLRNLSYDKLKLSSVIINACSFLFILTFAFSFCTPEDECYSRDGLCCDECRCCCENGDYNFTAGAGRPNTKNYSIQICLFFLFQAIFIALFYLVKACGKGVGKMVSIISLFLMNVTLVVLSLCSGFNKFCILLAVFSFFAALCDLIIIILVICFVCDCHKTNNDNNKLNNSSKQIQMDQPQTNTSQKLIEVQAQYEKPYYEEAYPNSKDLNQETIGKPVTFNYSDQNQGNNYNSETPTVYDTPSPEYEQQNNNDNNQMNIPYTTSK